MKADDVDLDELTRIVRSNEAWFDASHAWLASESCPQPRPLSLASLDALRLMDIGFSECPFTSPLHIGLYRWLHTAPLHEVKLALWTGSWRSLFAEPSPLSEDVIAAFRAERDRLAAVLAAVTISIRAKPREKSDEKTPPDVIAPTLATFRAVTIASALKADLEHVRWHLPIVQALQVYHHALWSEGRWTVRPGREVTREELEDLTPEALRDE
jgi:hypothetical protein